ncbi:MAG: hypothetical protein Q4C23_04270 [Mycoplasmatota bacterium]|nr:hypothetical protein [Mycoplasmatota bacterium]
MFSIIRLPFEIVLLPFRIIGAFTPRTTRRTRYYKNDNIWGLSKEDKRIAREERMSDADYIEAEERDDDNLDYDD